MIRRSRKPNRCFQLFLSTCLVATLTGTAALADVKVEFSADLMGKMDRINALEKEEEVIFRESRTTGRNANLSAEERFAGSRNGDQNWANEQLFPDIETYEVSALFEKMLEAGVKEADPTFDGTVVLHVDKLRISGFPLVTLRVARRTQAAGTVTLLDAEGNVVAEHDIWSGMNPKKVARRGYKGPGYKYTSSQMSSRVGPIAAELTEKVLETLYPEYDAPGAVSAGG